MIANLCPTCMAPMEITLFPTEIEGKFRKKAECKEHGRIFSTVEMAAAPEVSSEKGNLLCKACGARVEILHWHPRYDRLVCKQCREANDDIAEMNRHMKDIANE